MRLKVQIKVNSIINLLTIILICSFTILTTYTWGRYVMLASIVVIFLVDVLKNNMKYKFQLGNYFFILFLFAIYSLLSAIWAEDALDAIEKAKTLIEMNFMVFVLYNAYCENSEGVSELLYTIKWSSFIVVLYSFYFYGINNLLWMAKADGQIGLENTYANVNTIGMLAALGILIQIDEMIRAKRIKLSIFLCVPSFLLLALTQSRKAFVILLLGSVMLVMLRNFEGRDIKKKLFKICISLIICVMALYIALKLPILSGVLNRMKGLMASFTGVGSVDNSTYVRNRMVEIGWNQFLKTPLLGMGIGNPHRLAIEYLGKDAYLHNNFIELLAGGGIVGFCIYYLVYVCLFRDFWKYRNVKNKEYIICFTIMFVFLLMDYGRVSYYSKINYIFFLLYFLEVTNLKRLAQKAAIRSYYR